MKNYKKQYSDFKICQVCINCNSFSKDLSSICLKCGQTVSIYGSDRIAMQEIFIKKKFNFLGIEFFKTVRKYWTTNKLNKKFFKDKKYNIKDLKKRL